MNVWKYDNKNGEQQLTHYIAPDFVESFYLEKDSLICFVNKYGYVKETDVRRVAYPVSDG